MSQRIVIETHEPLNGTPHICFPNCEMLTVRELVLDEMVEKGAVALGNRRDGWKYDDPEWWRNDMRDDARAVLVAALGLEET